MEPGMEPGRTATVEIVVDATMFAAFEGQVVHPVYSTAAMITHMELAGRRIILPFLEPHEEDVGYEIAVRHLAPTVAACVSPPAPRSRRCAATASSAVSKPTTPTA